jgi:hypothetical protein
VFFAAILFQSPGIGYLFLVYGSWYYSFLLFIKLAEKNQPAKEKDRRSETSQGKKAKLPDEIIKPPGVINRGAKTKNL